MSSVDKNVLSDASGVIDDAATREYVTATIDGQLFGVPVLSVQDVLGPQRLANIPLAPHEIAGALNLRGRIVTAIDLRRRLGLPAADKTTSMSIVVDRHGELYSLLIDEVGEVLSVPSNSYERNPPTLDARWREVSGGIYRLEGRLMVFLEVDRLLEFTKPAIAA